MSSDSRDGANRDRSASLKENEAEAVYRSLFENLDDGFELLEVMRNAGNKPCDVRILALNKAYEELTGERPDQLIGRKWSELAVEPAWFERVFRVAESGRAERHEDRRELQDRFIEASCFKIAEDRVGVLFRDITRRKETEDALRESEAKYRDLFNSMSESFTLIELVHDANGRPIDFRYLDINPAQERLIGRKREEALGKRFTEVFGAIEDYWLEAFDKVIKSGEPGFVRNYNAIRDRYYDAVIWRPAEGQCGILCTDVTDVKRAEKALRQSEERMKAIAETSIIEISVSTLDGMMLFVNDAYAEAFGYSKEELIGFRTPDLYVDQGDREYLIDTLKEQGSVKNFETRVKRKDGTTFWIAASIVVIDYGGQRAVLGVSTDITERKQAEEDLKESEAKYRTLFDSIDEGFCIIEVLFDHNGKPVDYVFLETNPAFERQTGIRNGVGRRMRDIEPRHEEFWFETYGRIAKTGKAERFVHEAKPLMGGWYDVFAFRIGGEEDGKVAIVFNDITGRKLAEEKVEEERARLQGILETAPVGIAIAEVPSGRFLYANDGLWRMYMLEPKAVPTTEDYVVFRLFHEDGRPFAPEDYPMARAAKGEVVRGLVSSIVRGDGTHGFVTTNAAPIRDHSGKIIAVVGASTDITGQLGSQEELRRSNAELQQFAYVASHDLQEPLRMVTSYIGLLNKKFGDELSPQAKEFMSYAFDGSVRMKELIDDLLAYSRIDSRPIVLENINMNEVAGTVEEDLHIAIKETAAEVIVEPLPTICADRSQVKQLLTNLLTNAIKFRGETRPRIEVSAVTCGNDFVFAIKDNGIGIDPKYADKLFKMFSRLHTRDEYPGTGIGLAISKKIVERHGGKIWFESEPGHGTTFYFTVPSRARDEA